MVGVVLASPVSARRGVNQRFFQTDPRTAVQIKPDARLQDERQQDADSDHAAVVVDFVPLAEKVDAGKEGEKGVERAPT